MDHIIRCSGCRTVYTSNATAFRCTKCNAVLELCYTYPDKIKFTGKISHRRYSPLYPTETKLASHGEGGTKLVKAKSDTHAKLFLKIETQNPTRSFKDRGSSVEITKALEFGYRHVTCASTGNMALSVATYAAHQGLESTIFLGRNVHAEKLQMIKQTGARIIRVRGDFNNAMAASEKFAAKHRAFLCGDYHYRKEGQKSVCFEVLEQLKSPVDYIVVQVGNSTLLAAAFKAMLEFKRFGIIRSLPRLVAVQSSRCDPLIEAFKSHNAIRYVRPHTAADAIAVGYPTFGKEGIAAITRTHGTAVAVSDKQIAEAANLLRQQKIKAELAGAAGLAGFIELSNQHPELFYNKNVVVIVTGNN